MRSIRRCLSALLLTIGISVSAAWEAQSETEVDLALVLAVDISFSMEKDEQELQREGFVEAFWAPEVHEAIHKGMLGRKLCKNLVALGDLDEPDLQAEDGVDPGTSNHTAIAARICTMNV